MKSGAIITKDDNGITYLSFEKGSIRTLEIVQNDWEEIKKLNPDNPILILIDPTNIVRVEKDAKDF